MDLACLSSTYTMIDRLSLGRKDVTNKRTGVSDKCLLFAGNPMPFASSDSFDRYIEISGKWPVLATSLN